MYTAVAQMNEAGGPEFSISSNNRHEYSGSKSARLLPNKTLAFILLH